jgi:hypothetical protein
VDIENLLFTFDLANGGRIRPTSASRRISASNLRRNPCNVNQIRKINIVLTNRSRNLFGW